MSQRPRDATAPPPPTGGPSTDVDLNIDSGDCYISLSFDIAFSVDVDRAAALLEASSPDARIATPRDRTDSFEFRPPPLVFDEPAEPIDLGPARTEPLVRCIVHQFGAASIVYRIPIRGPLAALVRLSDGLYDNRRLMSDAKRRVERLMAGIGPALARPGLSPLTEDYAVYHLRSISPPLTPDQFVALHCGRIAQILRSEPRDLSAQEVADAIEGRMSLTPRDMTIVDWNAALILQPEPAPGRAADEAPTPGDIRAVLEFANISLLELRFLDDRLDRAMDTAPARQPRMFGRSRATQLRRLSELQADAATLFDAVNNSFKLVGDPYLARVYRVASKQLHLAEWDTGIRGRLATAEAIYSRLADFRTARRMEVLEWVIILLIAFEVVMALIRR